MKTTTDGSKGGVIVGNSHANNGVPAVSATSSRPIELEGKELIINGTSATSDKEYTVSGTPRQIASAVNSVDGNGVVIEEGAVLEDHQSGEVVQMEQGGDVANTFEGSINHYLWFLKWWEAA